MKSTSQPSTSPSLLVLHKKTYAIFKYLYSNDKDFYNIKTINEIICNEPTHTVALFKDYLIMGDYSEFIQKYYHINQSKTNLIKVFDYYESCSVIFPNYFVLPESKYLYKNIQRKQRVIDIQQEQELELEQKKYKKMKIELPKKEDKVFNTEVFDSLMNLTQTSTIRNILGLNMNSKGGGNVNKDIKCDDNVYEDNNNKSIQNIIDAIMKCEQCASVSNKRNNSNSNCNNNVKGRNSNVIHLNNLTSHHLHSGSHCLSNNAPPHTNTISSVAMLPSNDKTKVPTHKSNKTLTIYNFHYRLHNINTNTINTSHSSRNKISSSNTVSNNNNNTHMHTHSTKMKMKSTLTETNINSIKHKTTEHSNSLLHLQMEKTSSHKSSNSIINTFMNSKKDLVLKVLKDIQTKNKYTNTTNHVHNNHISSSSRNYSSKKIKPSLLTDIELNKNYSSSSINHKHITHNEIIPKLNSIGEYKSKPKDKTRNHIQPNKGLSVKIPSMKTELSLTKNESNTNYKDNTKFPLNPHILEMLNSKIKKMKSLNKKQFLPNNITSNSINKSNNYISVTHRNNNSNNKQTHNTKTQSNNKFCFSSSSGNYVKGKHKKKISISPSNWNNHHHHQHIGKISNTLTTTTMRTYGSKGNVYTQCDNNNNNSNNGNGKIKVFIPIRKDNQQGVANNKVNVQHHGEVFKIRNNSNNGNSSSTNNTNNICSSSSCYNNNNNTNVRHVLSYTDRSKYRNTFNKKN